MRDEGRIKIHLCVLLFTFSSIIRRNPAVNARNAVVPTEFYRSWRARAKTLVILNPIGRMGRAIKVWHSIETALHSSGIEFDLVRTEAPLHSITIADGLGRIGILSLLPKVMKVTQVGDPRVKFFRAPRIVIESPDPLAVEADGEIPWTDAHRLVIEALPKRMRVIC